MTYAAKNVFFINADPFSVPLKKFNVRKEDNILGEIGLTEKNA